MKSLDNPKVLIVDDEKLARQKIRRFLEGSNVNPLVEEAVNGLEALSKISSTKPDIVFLDIQMPGLSGFEVLQHLEERSFKLIFQTAYDEYAIQAFEENACDYLLKPFTRERFQRSFERAMTSLGVQRELSHLERRLVENKKFLEKIAVKQGSKFKIINLNDVICFISQDHYTCAYVGSSEYICDPSLSHLEGRLPPDVFLRLHRNNIVKVSEIKSVMGGENMTAELSNGLKLPVSRNNRKRLKELL